jgi:sugar lactone lactonase YvrE
MCQFLELPWSKAAAQFIPWTAPVKSISPAFAGLRRYAVTALRWGVVLAVALGVASGVQAVAQTAQFGSAQLTLPVSGLQMPGGVALDAQGNVYVADFAVTPQVYKETYSAGGYAQSTIAVTGLVSPRGIALDSTGNLYVADLAGQQVLKVAYNGVSYGATSVVVASTYGISPAGVAVDSIGNVYFTSWGDPNVRETPVNGGSGYGTPAILAQFAAMSQPYAITFDAAGNLFVSDYGSNDVQVLSQTGGIWNLATTTVATVGLSNTTGIAVDANENVFLLSAVSSGQLVMLPSTGTLTWGAQLAVATTTSSSTQNLAVDAGGNLYLADLGNSRVSIVSWMGANFGKVAVGASSAMISLNFAINTPGKLGNIQVLTQGVTGLDFVNQGTGSCVTGVAFSAGTICTVNVLFVPEYAGLRSGAVELIDTTGHILATGFLQGVGNAPQLAFNGATFTTVAGSTTAASPWGLAVDAAGNLYETAPSGVFKIAAGGALTTVTTSLTNPSGVAVDGAGNLYLADFSAGIAYEINTLGVKTQIATGLSFPTGVAVNGAGVVYVASSGDGRIIMLTPLPTGVYTQSTLTTVPGAQGLAVDGSGNLYAGVYSSGNSVIKISPAGLQTTVGTVTTGGAWGVAVDASGTVYAADYVTGVIDQFSPSGSSYTVSTLASGLTNPSGLAMDAKGNLYVDQSAVSGSILVEDRFDAPTLNFAATAPLATNGPQTVTVANIGNQTLSFPVPGSGNNPYLAANFSLLNTGTCPIVPSSAVSAGTLASGYSCTLLIDFAPAAVGVWNGSLTLTDNSLNKTYAVQTLPLNGAGTGTVSTTTVVVSSLNPATHGQSVTLTATVTAGSGSVLPTGTVQFMVGAAPFGPAQTLAGGVAAYTSTALPVGADSITAVYTPPACDPTTTACMGASTSAALAQTVESGNYNGAVQAFYNSTSWTYDASTNVSICVTPSTSVAATGTVLLYDGSSLVATLGLQGNSCMNQWYITPILNAGSHVMTVQYLGDGNNPSGTSAPTVLTVAEAPVSMQVSCWSTQNYLYNSNYDCNVSVSSTTTIQPTGSVDYIFDTSPVAYAALSNDDTSITLVTPAVGTHTLNIYYPQTGNYAASGAQTETFTITGAPTYMTLNLSSYYLDASTPLTLTAQVTSNAGLGTPTGNITFYDNGAPLATVAVDGTGKASYIATGLAVGSNAFTATFTSAYYLTSTAGPQTANVTQAAQTITFTGLPASVTYAAGLNYTLGATASSTLPVSYTVTGPAYISTGVLYMTGAGTVAVTASQAGNANYLAATPVTVTIVVNPISVTMVVSGCTASPFAYGSNYSCTVTLSPTAATGSINYVVDGTSFTAPLTTGVASFSVPLPAAANHQVVVSYPGQGNYGAAAAQTESFTVTPAVVSVVLSTTTVTPTAEAGLTLLATTSAIGATPAGSIAFYNGGTLLATVPVNGSGTASYTIPYAAGGSQSFTALYAGSSNFVSATSNTLSLTVALAAQSINFAPPASPVTYGVSPITLYATATSGDAVTFTATGPGFISGNLLTVTGMGSIVVTANQAGDSNYAAAPPVSYTILVNPIAVTMSPSCWNSSFAYGANYTCSVSLSSNAGSPTGSISYSVDGGGVQTATLGGGTAQFVVTQPAAGSHSVAISYPGAGNYAAAATQTESFTVTSAPVNVALTPSNWSPVAQASFVLTATVTASGAGTPTPSGTVAFYDGATLLQSLPLAGNGVAILTLANGLSGGSHTIWAYFTGSSANYAANSTSITLTVGQASQFITFTGLPTSATFGAAGPYTLGATATSGLTVSYGVTGPATLNGTTLTIAGAGTVVVTANQAGNANYSAATPVSQSITVNQAVPIITWNPPASVVVGATLDGTELNATASVPGFFIYTPGAGSVLNAVGVQQIQAVFTPNDTVDYSIVTEVVSITVEPVTVISGGTYTLSANPASLTVTAGSSGTSTFTMTPSGGYTGTVTLSCGDLPTGVTCSFAPSSLTGDGLNTPVSSLLTVTVAAQHAMNEGRSGMALAGFFFLPGLLLGGLLAWQRKRLPMWSKQLMALAILALMMGGASGCSGASFLGAAPSTQAVKVVAVSTVSATNSTTTTNTGTFTLTIVR